VTWTLSSHEVRTFEQNTLAAVIVQLRFHPILKIAELFPDFQDKVRSRFPGYEFADTQLFDVGPAGVHVRNETAHRFPALTEPTVLSLGTSAVSIEYSAHKHREVLFGDVDMVVGALGELFAPVFPIRLGLRYVNIIQRERIGEDLARPTPWTDLLTPSFAAVPAGVATVDDATNYAVEVSSGCKRGKMTLRYGLIPTPASREAQQFRLDTDRYIEGSLEIGEVRDILSGFSEDIFQVFMTAAGPALLEWMEQKRKS
jgi:uncharacterized protein (TIGR04255 family)